MSLSQNIKRLRTTKGLTQEQLANVLGVSSQAISKWETSDTYPDGALLVPLAQALDASLDELFDHRATSMRDISARIRRLLHDTPTEAHFSTLRDLCWQIEKGLFNCHRDIGQGFGEGYDPEEIKNQSLSSYSLCDQGFTHVSNGRAPFFLLFPTDGKALSEVIGDGEEMRAVFEALGDRDTMRALLHLLRLPERYVFEAPLLANECDIADEKLPAVMASLKKLGVIGKREVELDGSPCALYTSFPSHLSVVLLLIVHEMFYRGGYCYQKHYRANAPYLT